MSYQRYQTVAFGSSKAGLVTVGYRLYNADGTPNGARITAGVQDLADGQYGATVTFPTGFVGRITWDTGGGSPVHASAGVNIDEQTLTDIENLLETVIGSGSLQIDHNYGGTDNLRYIKNGVGIDNADIYVYLTADYAAGRRDNNYIIARTTTDVTGRWTRPVMLDPNTYTLVFFKQNLFGPDVVTLTVS